MNFRGLTPNQISYCRVSIALFTHDILKGTIKASKQLIRDPNLIKLILKMFQLFFQQLCFSLSIISSAFHLFKLQEKQYTAQIIMHSCKQLLSLKNKHSHLPLRIFQKQITLSRFSVVNGHHEVAFFPSLYFRRDGLVFLLKMLLSPLLKQHESQLFGEGLSHFGA